VVVGEPGVGTSIENCSISIVGLGGPTDDTLPSWEPYGVLAESGKDSTLAGADRQPGCSLGNGQDHRNGTGASTGRLRCGPRSAVHNDWAPNSPSARNQRCQTENEWERTLSLPAGASGDDQDEDWLEVLAHFYGGGYEGEDLTGA
jgi:hypothetical protein